jgi:hypothetical protein
VGLDITNSSAQFVGFLGASAARLIWDSLHLAIVDVVQQRSEDLPSSLRTSRYDVKSDMESEEFLKIKDFTYNHKDKNMQGGTNL